MENNGIILVGPQPPPFNGQTVAFQALVDELRQHTAMSVNIINLTSPRYKTVSGLRRVFDYFFIFIKYFQIIKGGGGKVYLTISQSPKGFARDFFFIWMAVCFRRPVICHLHGGNYNNFYNDSSVFLRFLIKITLRQASKIIVLSKRLKYMFDFDPKLGKKIHYVPNGLPTSKTISLPKKLPTTAATPIVILYLSNLIESKGYFDVLEATRILVREYGLDNIECHFCGEFKTNVDDKFVKTASQARKIFFEYIYNNKLEQHVKYLGVVQGAEKEIKLKEAHFFILPTYYVNEGQPISIIEAMAYGTVVISTNYRAIPDMVIDGKNGYLVPPQSPHLIADRINYLICHPWLYSQMSHAAIEHCNLNYTKERHLSDLLSAIFDVSL